MAVIEPGTEFLHLQDVLGQLLMLRTYTQISLFFVNDDESAIPKVLDELKAGLVRLAKNFPWLAGQVVIREKNGTNGGYAQVIPCENEISFVFNDLRNDTEMPSLAALQAARFPSRLLHREKIARPPGVGETLDALNGEPARVLVLQVSAIQGGYVLTFAGVHHTMDMNGLGQIIYLFSKACQKQPFTAKEVELGNSSRKELIPLLGDDFMPGPKEEDFILKAKATDAVVATSAQTSPATWAYFTFEAEKLQLLKAKAATQKVTDYISVNDALSALIYRHTSKVRAARSMDLNHGSMFRCVDGRKMFNVGPEYLGHMVAGKYRHEGNVFDIPLDELSGRLRKDMLDTPSMVQSIRALVTLFDRAEDKTTINYCPNVDPTRDLLMSSWAKVPCYECAFGSLGRPECVRRARLATFEGLVYFMPKARDGEIAVAICLREDDIDALRQDEEFMKYATYIG